MITVLIIIALLIAMAAMGKIKVQRKPHFELYLDFFGVVVIHIGIGKEIEDE